MAWAPTEDSTLYTVAGLAGRKSRAASAVGGGCCWHWCCCHGLPDTWSHKSASSFPCHILLRSWTCTPLKGQLCLWAVSTGSKARCALRPFSSLQLCLLKTFQQDSSTSGTSDFAGGYCPCIDNQCYERRAYWFMTDYSRCTVARSRREPSDPCALSACGNLSCPGFPLCAAQCCCPSWGELILWVVSALERG